jgi:hypothetical protein
MDSCCINQGQQLKGQCPPPHYWTYQGYYGTPNFYMNLRFGHGENAKPNPPSCNTCVGAPIPLNPQPHTIPFPTHTTRPYRGNFYSFY